MKSSHDNVRSISTPSEKHHSESKERSSLSDNISSRRVNSTHTPRKPAWKDLFVFISRAHLAPLIVAVLAAMGAGAVNPIQSIFLGKAFDLFTAYGAGNLQADDFRSQVGDYAVYLTALGAGALFFHGASFMASIILGETQARRARTTIFSGLMKRSSTWFDTRPSGIAAQLPRMESQIREIQLALAQPLGKLVEQTTAGVAALIIAFVYAWDLTLVILATVPLMAAVLAYMSRRMQPSVLGQQKELESASKIATNAFANIETVKCFNGQETELKRYLSPVQKAALWYRRQAMSNAFQIGIARMISLAIYVQAFWYGHHLVVSGKRSTGDVVTTFWSSMTATLSLEILLPQLIVLEKGRTAGFALKSNLPPRSETKQVGGALCPDRCLGHVELQQVTFAYPARPERLALDNVSCTIEAGSTTFIIGRSGSGKSTLGQLLLQFYEPQSGVIRLDGNDLTTLNCLWLRQNITLVEQNSVLFQGTLEENIAFGVSKANVISAEDIRLAAEFALLQQTINDLPDGTNTEVGARGGSLSGGQRQRMSLARARLRDTPVLILDEATSALDNITRTLVMTAIREWRRDRTTLVVTHDISQIEDRDHVIIMESGRVVQSGIRAQLNDGPGQPLRSFSSPATGDWTSGLGASDKMSSESGTSLNSAKPKIFFKEGPSEPRTGFQSIPTIFSNRISMPLTQVGFSQAVGRDRASFILHSGPSTKPAAFSEHARGEKKDAHDRLNQRRSQRLSQIAMELVNTAADAAIQNRTGIINRRGRRKSVQQVDIEKSSLEIDDHTQVIKGTTEDAPLSLKAIFATIWPTLDPKAKKWLAFGILGTVAHAVSVPVFSWVFAQLISTFYAPDGGSQKTLIWSMTILALAIIDGTACFTFHLFLEYCGQQWIDRTRSHAMRKVLNQPRAFFAQEGNAVSTLVSNFDRNAEEMRNLLGRFAPYAATAVIILFMALIWALVVSWRLTLVSVAVAPLSYGITQVYQSISAKYEGLCNDASDYTASITNETFTSIKTVRALTLEDNFGDKHSRASTKALKIGFKRASYCGVFHGLSESIVLFVTALVFYYGAVLTASGHNTVNDILTVISMLLFGFSNITAIMNFIPQIGSSKDTAQRVLEMANLPETSHEHNGDLRVTDIKEINCNSLSFSYESRPHDLVLRAINVRFAQGLSTALVGPSGSGKSTIASLLLRLYPAPRAIGNIPAPITIGSHDISDVKTESLRESIAVVPQTCVLFPCSVADNIAYGLPADSDRRTNSRIRAAAEAAGIDDFILSLPQGYDTAIGDGGMGISGGQAQRLAIARALIREPKALLLDEATSALDVESAALVRHTIRKLMDDRAGGITVIMITHDEKMMEMADRVVMLDKGRIVDEGRFADLMLQNGSLANLLNGGQWKGQRDA